MALAVILVAGAALMIRTFVGLRSVQPGFDPHNVITMQTSLSGGRYDNTAKAENMTRQVVDHIETLPGVRAAAAAIRCRWKAASICRLRSQAYRPPRATCTTATNSGDSSARTISARSASPCCAGAPLMCATRANRNWWSSSTRPSPRNIGRKAIRSDSASPSARGWGRSLKSPRAKSSASSATCAKRDCKAPTKA